MNEPSRDTGQSPSRSTQLSVGHTEQAAQDTTDPVQRLHAEKEQRVQRMQQAIENSGSDDVRDKVIAALKEVYDPEIPVNIYELGLIYEVEVLDGNNVRIVMTLTSPACPVAQELPLEVRRAAECVPEVDAASVELTFEPPWSMEKMSDEAKAFLGFM